MDGLQDQVMVGGIESADHDMRNGDTSAAGGASLRPPSPDQASYTPQFSSNASIIMDRIKSSRQENMLEKSRTEVAHDLDATLPVPSASPLLQTLPMSTNPTSAAWSSSNAGAKRKRESSTEKVDFTQSTVAFPVAKGTDALQPSLQSRPTVQPVQCSKCEGSAQTSQGPLATCAHCLRSWHHQCHAPTITSEAMAASIFVCAACAADQEQAVRLKGKSNQQRQYEVEKLRQKRLAALPRGVVPAKPGLVGFGAGRAPDSSRTEYFDQMRKTDLLNILSLCDQLKPNLLVDILVSVSKRHPDLPMFDSPDWEAQLATPFRVHKLSKHEEKPRHGHVIISSKARSKHKTTKKILKRTRVIEVITTAPEEDEDILPPTWAKAGEGLYAKLPPETEDRSLLMDENDEESFSHFSVDGFGKQIMEPVGA
ncbi:hypothetical protein NCS57_00089100 [Fusarium keratoplasticum]|uniref:Uncharacterized protein n=1 Tax=Fusarium keratoplasticum TaxID=1328300 RepID=A0ACC0RF92_9HYPO|nr:hypothetical protein NCS57_00089100 [Fusarium keratoplasticum]KAI8684232.1 hypothetical protein NCS57_00089100 [Fusarium keratoplasticum]KAI8688345.1 hypothetical protein NCS55_00088200 [Fusarium keratoplasticum]